jgi:hypothetical protein
VNETELLPDDASAESAVETSAVVPAALAKAPSIPVAAEETPQPSESDATDFRPRKRGRVVFAAIVGGVAAIAALGVGFSRFAHQTERSSGRVPERAPAPASPAPSPVAATTTATPITPAAAPEAAVAAPVEKATTSVTVTVKTFPQEAVIFRAGKRIGAGVVEVSVERNVKERLTALHDGYLPSNVVIDGSRDSVTIRLRRVPKPPAEPAPDSDSPYGETPSADATAATAPSTTVAPTAAAAPTPTAAFPTGTTPQPAPAPNAPSGESPTP